MAYSETSLQRLGHTRDSAMALELESSLQLTNTAHKDLRSVTNGSQCLMVTFLAGPTIVQSSRVCIWLPKPLPRIN